MGFNNRKSVRVHFEFGYLANITGIDGTWQRRCRIDDISQSGARISIEGSIEHLNLTEFFLILSRTGHAYRRCQLVWLKGDAAGLRFLQAKPSADSAVRTKRRLVFVDDLQADR